MAYFSIESAVALGLSLFINVWVVSVFAAGFYGHTEVHDIGLENAGNYLGQRFGSLMKYVWAIGLLAAGEMILPDGALWAVFPTQQCASLLLTVALGSSRLYLVVKGALRCT